MHALEEFTAQREREKMGSTVWRDKINQLISQQDLTQGTLSEKLGITPRTLSDFMREDGREPTGAVAKLIDFLLGEEADASSSRSLLNLVFIHRDYVIKEGGKGNPAEVASELSKAVGSGIYWEERNESKFRDEFHYITYAPSGEGGWALEEGLRQRKIQPHFLPGDGKINQAALDCYFSATTMAQVARSLDTGIARVVIAANSNKFWSLGYEIKNFANVPVTFVLESHFDESQRQSLKTILEEVGLFSIVVGGRHLGKIVSKKQGYGFIEAENKERLFFSWNGLKKGSDGSVEMEFEDLHEQDEVSFDLGENHMGPCAVDVALVKPAKPSEKSILPSPQKKLSSSEDIPQLKRVIREAIISCADEKGWAKLSAVGGRLEHVLLPGYKQRLDQNGYKSLKDFLHRDMAFEVTGTNGMVKTRIISSE